jgi:hypothetical protein
VPAAILASIVALLRCATFAEKVGWCVRCVACVCAWEGNALTLLQFTVLLLERNDAASHVICKGKQRVSVRLQRRGGARGGLERVGYVPPPDMVEGGLHESGRATWLGQSVGFQYFNKRDISGIVRQQTVTVFLTVVLLRSTPTRPPLSAARVGMQTDCSCTVA